MFNIINSNKTNLDNNDKSLKNIEDRIDTVKKYLEYIKKYHEIKYLFYAVINYKIAKEAIIKIEEERLKEKNNKNGIEEFKQRKYDVFIISENIANEKDKKTFEEIEKEIKLMDEIQKQEKQIIEIKDYLKNELNENDIKLMLR